MHQRYRQTTDGIAIAKTRTSRSQVRVKSAAVAADLCYLPADDEGVGLSVAGADVSRVTSRHVGWRGAPRSSHFTRPAAADCVLRDDTERIVGPRRQRHTKIARITPDVRPGRAPDVRSPRSVVLDNEPTNWGIVLAEQLPVKLDDASIAHCPVYVHRSIGNVFVKRIIVL